MSTVRWCGALAAALFAACLPAQQELEALVDQLGSSDAQTRSQAYTTLLRNRSPDVVALIGKRIDAFPPEGQQLALYVLQMHGIDVTRALYTRLLAADRALLRAFAAAMLVRSGDKSRLPLLAKAVVAAPRDDRQLVLNTLYSIDDAAVADAVRGYVTPDGNAPLVVSAMQHLRQQEKVRSPATTAAVRALLSATNADLRAAALVWFVSGDGGDAFVAELAELLRADTNRFWMIERLFERDRKYPQALADAFAAALAAPRMAYDVTQVAALMKTQAPERLTAILRDLLQHKNDDVRTAAMQALAAVPGGVDGKSLQAMLQTGAPDQQLAAAALLRRMDDPSGLPVVLELVQKPGKHTAEAVRVLGGFRSRDVVEPLLLALDDGNAQVRQNAWTALQQVMRDLFPYRRFDFDRAGYNPASGDRSAGIKMLRAWWSAVH